LSDDELKNYVLYELEQLFNVAAITLKDHKLPMPDGRLLDEIKNRRLREELIYDVNDLQEQHSISYPSLNKCQKQVYEYVVNSILSKQVLAFVHGHRGTGKTFLWHTLITS
jgi:flagellar biosynthesis GTPase FlhF